VTRALGVRHLVTHVCSFLPFWNVAAVRGVSRCFDLATQLVAVTDDEEDYPISRGR